MCVCFFLYSRNNTVCVHMHPLLPLAPGKAVLVGGRYLLATAPCAGNNRGARVVVSVFQAVHRRNTKDLEH